MELRPIALRGGYEQKEMEDLLRAEGVRLDACLDYACGLYDEEETLLACGGCYSNTLRCLAVDSGCRGEGFLVQILSHLMDIQARRGNLQVFLYTKPENLHFFTGLGFSEVARTDTAVFLENRRDGLDAFCASLEKRPGDRIAAVVMNANPFTLGHRHLLEQAAKENDLVHLFLLREEAGPIPFAVRKKLVCEGTEGLHNVVIQDTGSYLISAATFPSYFLKDRDAAIAAQAKLDLAVFTKIARKLNIQRRYVGEEPQSHVTALYNRIMAECLPENGIDCVIVPRVKAEGKIISASTVRQAIWKNDLESVRNMLPDSTYRYFASSEGETVVRAIRQEKDVIHY